MAGVELLHLCLQPEEAEISQLHYQCGQAQKSFDGTLHYKSEEPKCTCSHSILIFFYIIV